MGCWEAKETPIKMMHTCDTFSSFGIGRRGTSYYLRGLVFLLPSPLIATMVIWEFLGDGRLLTMFIKAGVQALPGPMVGK